jgi:succinoglycan biosynthesis transport protein ExoP
MANNYDNNSEVGRTEISAREVLTVVFRRKIPILICTVVIAAAALTAASRTTSVYEATVKVLLRRMGATALATTWTPFYGLEEEMNTEVEIVSTPSVLDRALELLNERGVFIQEKAGDSVYSRQPTEGDLAGGVAAEPIEMSNIILIKYRGPDPDFAAYAAEAVAEAYVEHRVIVRKTGEIEDFFQDQLSQTEARLIDLKEHELELRREGEIYDLEYQQTVAIRNRGEFEYKLGEIRSERIAEERKLAAIKRRIEEDPDLLLPFSEFAGDKLVTDMLASYWNLRADRDEKASYLTEQNPEVRMLDDRIEKMKQRFHDEVNRRVNEKEFYIEDLRAQEVGLKNSIDEISEQLRETPEIVAMIEHVEKEIFYTYAHYDQLLEKMLETVVSQANDTRISNAKVISGASVQATRAGRMKSVYVVFSILLGVTLGVGFGFLLDNLDHSVRSADDVESVLGVPVLGSVPDSGKLSDMTYHVNRLERELEE